MPPKAIKRKTEVVEPMPVGSNEKKSRKGFLSIAAGAVLVLVVALVLVYLLTAPPDGRTASKQYIEDHYDALAETAVEFVFRENSLKTELIAEVAESAAEQIVPYDCTQEGYCALAFSVTKPFAIDINAPLEVTLESVSGPFGQKGYAALDAEFVPSEMAINSASLESLRDIREEVAEAADEARESVDKAEDAANQMLDRVFGGN